MFVAMGGLKILANDSTYTIAERAVRLLEQIDKPLPYWDIRRLLRANGGDVWEPSLKAVLATDLRTCWAGSGTYGLFRHGLLPRVRDLARVGGIYLQAADRPLRLQELAFVLSDVGYRFRELSLRSALMRGLELGIYRLESVGVFSASRVSLPGQQLAAQALGLRRGSLFDAVVDRAARQVDHAIAEMERRRGRQTPSRLDA